MPNYWGYGDWGAPVIATPAEIRARLGRAPTPVRARAQRRKIADTFWGTAWCNHLETYRDMSNRLPRGRTYLRGGHVRDLHIERGKVTGLVQGTELYEIAIDIDPMSDAREKALGGRLRGELASVIELLEGRLNRAVMAAVTDLQVGLFPARREIRFSCSCPDGARVCKHVAAIFYGIALRLDERPELFFELRGLEPERLVEGAALGLADAPSEGRLEGDLSDIFGVYIEDALPSTDPPRAPKKRARKKASPKPAAKKTRTAKGTRS